MVNEECISCRDIVPMEDMIDYKGNTMCSRCTIGFIKSNITGGLDCEDLLKHIKDNEGYNE